MKKEWVKDIKKQCTEADVAFFFKQWGGTNKKKTGNLLDGKKYLEMPPIVGSRTLK
jgi:protein gp37